MTQARTIAASDALEWRQMRFRAADGHAEVLWVQPEGESYRVLNVPVWLYGISVGSRVRGGAGERWLEFEELVESSPGATVRLYLPDDAQMQPARRVYLERILADCRTLRIGVGPATFFDPAVVAIHVRERADWNTRMAEYLDRLVEEGVIEFWEVGDPDAYPPEEPDEPGEYRELIHERPGPRHTEII